MLRIPVVTERCAGIDVGKRGLAVAVATGPADKEAEIQTRWYGTTVPALEELASWLRRQGCTAVGMESTASYWIPVKNILERDFTITLAVRASTGHRKETRRTSVTPWTWRFISVTGC